jgi:hypothetical protein
MTSLALLNFGLCAICQKGINIKNCGNYLQCSNGPILKSATEKRLPETVYTLYVYRYTPKTLYDLYVTVREISSRLIESTAGRIVVS